MFRWVMNSGLGFVCLFGGELLSLVVGVVLVVLEVCVLCVGFGVFCEFMNVFFWVWGGVCWLR